MSVHYLLIGNGAAGMSAAEIIRQRDPHGRVTILTTEPYRFYSRPGIAYYLMGQVPERQVISRSEAFYRDHRLELRVGRVAGLDLERQVAHLEDGAALPYELALVATGSSAVPPSFPGGDLEGILTFDSLGDANRAIALARRAEAAVVVGGGITAMELVEGLHLRGVRSHLLQRGDHIWPRLLNDNESSIIEHQIRHEGIQLHYRQEIGEALGKNGRVTAVRLKDGGEIKCQIVGVAIGVRPNLALLAGLPVERDKGILVNEAMQSSVPTLFAAGDVAQVFDRWTGKPQLDVLWPSAINTGRAAGYNMVDVAHGRLPRYAYRKGSPFNAALLFGVHLTVIGQVGSEGGRPQDVEELSYLSRGSSQVWTAPFSSSYRSAWDQKGARSLRVALSEGRLVGALLLGNQELADPLRELIELEAPAGSYESALATSGPDLPDAIWRFWQSWRASGVPNGRA